MSREFTRWIRDADAGQKLRINEVKGLWDRTTKKSILNRFFDSQNVRRGHPQGSKSRKAKRKDKNPLVVLVRCFV